jgi:hypothetical protein
VQLDYDENKWPELSTFRKACLVNDYETMRAIAEKGHDWYADENPDDLSIARPATVLQWQHFAYGGDLDEIKALHEEAAWRLDHPWTAQGWLPLGQAVGKADRRRWPRSSSRRAPTPRRRWAILRSGSMRSAWLAGGATGRWQCGWRS